MFWYNSIGPHCLVLALDQYPKADLIELVAEVLSKLRLEVLESLLPGYLEGRKVGGRYRPVIKQRQIEPLMCSESFIGNNLWKCSFINDSLTKWPNCLNGS
jgi:hypothetical protein